jgi:allantoin racemase
VKIHVVIPIAGGVVGQSDEYFGRIVSSDTQLTIVGLDEGPSTIETDYDVVLAAPGVVLRAREAEAAGADAVVINCTFDPGLFACRESVRIPVVAPGQSSFALAGMLADRFSILGTTSRDVPFNRDLWRRYGHVDRGASVRLVGMTVQEMLDQPDDVFERMVEASLLAIQEDSAGALIIGCTLMAEHRDDLVQALASHGHRGVVVIDPLAAAVQIAETLVRLGLSHSGVTWQAL